MPYFHILDQGRLAPCIAHDLQGGFAKLDIVDILLDLSTQQGVCWTTLQDGISDLRNILKYEDKRDLSTRLPGKNVQEVNDKNFSMEKYFAAKASFTSITWKHAGVTTFLKFFSIIFINFHPTHPVIIFMC